MLKAKISKKFYYLITLLLPYNVLSACGLNSGPVSQLGEIIFLYSNGDNQQIKEYKMKADIGNPFSNDPKFYQFSSNTNANHFVSYQGLSNNEDKARANFFKPLAASALGFQINAINSRAALLRTYYYWLTSGCSNNNCGTIRKKNNLETYFGNDSQNKQLINNGAHQKNRNASSSNNQQLSINDWLFSFFLSNNLSVGDGFSVYPSALFFGLQKVIFHLDSSLKKVKFSNGTDPSYENSTNDGSNDSECFAINNDKYLKIKIQKIYYIYGFNQTTLKKNILQNYWKANPNSFPKLLQNKVTENLTFAVQMAPISLQAKINSSSSSSSSSSKISVLTNSLVWNNLDNNNNNNNNNKLYDNSLVEASKLFNYSSTAVSSGMKNVTFDKDINGYHYFPNNQKLSRYLTTSSSQKLFSKNNKNGNSFDWKQLRELTLTDLLMSFFSDFKFEDNNNNNNIKKNNGQNGNSSDQQWLTTKTAECLISQIKNGSNQQMNGKGNSNGCSASN